MPRLWIGLDPGVTGGIAAIYSDGEVRVAKMPHSDRELFLMLDQWGSFTSCNRVTVKAVLEHVWARPGYAGAFKFGKEVGRVQMALAAAGIAYELVVPQVWQKAMGCRTKGDKNVTKALAARLFPRLTIGHATADAVLIAEFARRKDLKRYEQEKQAEGRKKLQADREARARRKAEEEGPALAGAARHGLRTERAS